MKIFNTKTRRKEEFKIQGARIVKMYVCGPTVYDFAHIGNLRTYINIDLFRRFLKYSGFQVFEVMNITDVDDKTIKKANDEQESIKTVTQKYEKAFLADLGKLNIEVPEKLPHATDPEVIKQIIKIVQTLINQGLAYRSDDGSVYFSIRKFQDYGKLSGINMAGNKEGTRVKKDEYEKENPSDFAIWKQAKENEPSWDAPFGRGRPGWHIECSAMGLLFLGPTLDVHAGGVDLIFPHHENEIAQSESFSGKTFVNFWLHCEHLLVEGQKMSKSLNNIYTLKDLETKYRVEPLAFRLLALMSHYRERLNFTSKSIIQAQNTLENMRSFLRQNKTGISKVETVRYQKRFIECLGDDLGTPKALSVLFELINDVHKTKSYGRNVLELVSDLDRILGLELESSLKFEIPKKVLTLAESRERERKKNNWQRADEIRKEISVLGFEIEDTDNGPIIKPN